MKRRELEETIRQATRATERREVLVVGSLAILGSYDDAQLPERATHSEEVNIAPIADAADYTLATLIDAKLGEWSQFHMDHGFYVEGVNVTTAVLPNGWETRTVQLASDGPNGALARCLDPHDLCTATLVRGDEKDLEFVDALVEAGLIDPVPLVRICKNLSVTDTRRNIAIQRAGLPPWIVRRRPWS
ncbi:DUF6036 family nucleotidyltransferase [Cryobacterium sp. TMT3-29-2]|uniref:DUF6036 family nucleotidyltransferase n=1 Tax=Cryobacterium sp. TMT3-29-2 TaxID=2555867 RepID=UPI00107395B5|nr:DUF6036 family nucleotidyltransferase [Cryobacterium sp. TMT3-29-2]TFC82416.1 hypothetical protein E3O67_16615 [Cryobacterium sp. TMT3-29-2]